MEEIKQIVLKVSQSYGVDPHWVMAIILQESAGNRYQIRYEPRYRYLFHPDLFSKKLRVTLETETQSQKISWGVGQVMGALAREQGHMGLMAELIDHELNIKHVCMRLKNLRKYSNEKDDLFSMYNGGPGSLQKSQGAYLNQSYVDSVNQKLKSLEGD